MQDRVEEHVELTTILPSITRVRGEEQNTTFAHRNIHSRGPVSDFIRVTHQSTEDTFFPTRKAHENLASSPIRNQEMPAAISRSNLLNKLVALPIDPCSISTFINFIT